MRKTALITFLLTIVLCATACSHQVDAYCKPNRGWCAGNFRGLTVGQSTYPDMVRVLGKPLSSGPEADQDEPIIFIWHDYGKIDGDLQGRLGVVTDKRTNQVMRISIAPDDMTKEDAIKYFGKDYQIMGYELCEGYENETAVPIYENPKATEIKNVEYRKRGISISIDYRGRVDEINYVTEPVGLASKDDCKKTAASK